MKIALFLLLLAIPTRAQQRPIAIANVTVIDVQGGGAMPGLTMIIKGDRIAGLGPKGSISVPKGATVIDGAGKFLIPGLWDMHTHLSFATEKALPALIAHGVTGVRDLGSDLNQIDEWRREIANGERVGPSIYRAGPYVDGPKDDLPADRAAATLVVKTLEEAQQAVLTLKQKGVDLIKVHNALPREAFFALMEAARKQNLPVVVHLPRTSVRIEEASDAGVRSLEHTENLIESLVFADPQKRKPELEALAEFNDEKAMALFARFVKNGTYYAPTLIAYKEAIRMRETSNPISAAARKKVFPRFQQLVALMQRAGVRLLAASDFAWPELTTRPGVSLHDELALLVEAGLTPMQALRAATLHPAQSLGVADRMGSIARDKRADLMLLDADPLADISNTRKIRVVVAGGRLFESEALEKMVLGTGKP
jgi:imidazolonepropionase-like amidohydrolase